MKQTQLKRKTALSSFSNATNKKNPYKAMKGHTISLKTKKPLKSKAKLKSAKPIKVDMWSLQQADSLFAAYIKERDGCCQLCGTSQFLSCSHWNKREIWATRYDPFNSVTFCTTCHDAMERYKAAYRQFMVEHFSESMVIHLENLAKTRVSKEEAIRAFQKSVIHDLAVIKF